MKVFGYELQWPLKAVAPPLPPVGSDTGLVNILPPFGTNPPARPLVAAPEEYGERLIRNDPRELWYLALPYRMTPKQVVQILRAALGGDLWQQWQLLSLMLDSWPMLRKCAHELRQAVANAKWIVNPYVAEEGQDPTPSAADRADTVRRAINGMKPDPFQEEEGFTGMVYDVTDAMLNGLTLIELMWHEPTSAEILPRAAGWVHPRHFTFTTGGQIAIYTDDYSRLTWQPGGNTAPDPNKFLACKFKSRSGSSLGAGLMRPLAWYWSSVVFNREWMFAFAQKYGNPFLDATYKPGSTTANDLTVLRQLMAEAGAQGWSLRPEGTTLNILPAQSLGSDNAQVKLMEMADKAVQLLLLGQTATTEGTPGKLGGEDAHESVKREMVQGVAKWAGTVLTEQFAGAVLRLNYGDEEERPTIEPDFTGESDPVQEATRDAVFLTHKVPMGAEDFYRRHNLKMPQPGDKVLVGGQLGKMSETEEEVGGKQPTPEGLVPGQPNDDEGDEGSALAGDLDGVLDAATGEELEQLHAGAVKALAAPVLDGEWEAVQVKVKEINRRRRA